MYVLCLESLLSGFGILVEYAATRVSSLRILVFSFGNSD